MKIRLTLVIIASLLLFQGASPWEGSAAVAPNGELPVTGFYIATNAFPKNTVVDITNIENGKKTRVIVSNTLTSPGLLAVVSREAAELIGMRAGSISRIRMIQPTDPMAYVRFTQSMAAGTPEYDSGNVIDEEKLVEEVYNKDTYTPPETAAVSQPVEKTPTLPTAPGYIVDEPEWGGSGRLQIVDVPGYMVDPAEQPSVTQTKPDGEDGKKKEIELLQENQKDAHQVAETEEKHPKEPIKEVPEFITEAPREKKEPIKDAPQFITETPHGKEEPIKDVPQFITEAPREKEELMKDVPQFITEAPREKEEPMKEVPQFITEAPRQEVVKEVPPRQEKVEVVTTPGKTEAETQKETERQVLEIKETTPKPPPLTILDMFPDDFISGIASTAPGKTDGHVNENPPSKVNENPSIKTIDRLDRGKYYVQVAALSADLVESTLNQIDRSFAPVVFKGADNVYRVLIGPLNQGESAAVLVRFKSIGYKDAFVRKGG
ncbi:SPOR domain-containing protein [Treponema sp. R80B11-R83G3]